ncbi:MAG: hypothetical protein IPJ81_15610 [Chitinophagaceae bacterium]|nr:hypothetical protein [Chitinophagaceae bacterium]
MRLFLLFFCFYFTNFAYAQNADFIVLKKNGKTVNSYFTGTNIAFSTHTGAYVDAYIYGIKNDSLFLQEFIIQQVPTHLGVFIIDTLGSYHYKYHYSQIKALGPKPQRGFNVNGSGASLLGGGILLTLANAVVWLVDRDKFSKGLMLGSVGLASAGYLMTKSGNKGITIGNKYKIIYMNMSLDKKM